MRVIALGGEPATGKSTVMRAVMKALPPSHAFSFGRLKGHRWEAMGLWILGVYHEGEAFPGTDRLSMSVHPDAVNFLAKRSQFKETILFEGDRLVGNSFLTECQKWAKEFHFYFLTAPKDVVAKRRVARKDTMSETFLKGRHTKAQRLVNDFPAQIWEHNSPESTELLVNLLIAKVNKLHTT